MLLIVFSSFFVTAPRLAYFKRTAAMVIETVPRA